MAIENILAPQFLVQNIELVSFVVSVMILVIFDEFVIGKILFPVADFIKFRLARLLGVVYERRGIRSGVAKGFQRYSTEAVATIAVIVYCYLGYAVVSEFLVEPLLIRWRSVILLVVIILFFIFNYLINQTRWRRQFFGVGSYDPDKKKRRKVRTESEEE